MRRTRLSCARSFRWCRWQSCSWSPSFTERIQLKLLSVDAAVEHFGPPGYETDLLYLAALAALVLGGSGPFSLDRLILRKNWIGSPTPPPCATPDDRSPPVPRRSTDR